MIDLRTMSNEERKQYVTQVVRKLLEIYGYTKRQELEDHFGLNKGIINNWVATGSTKTLFELAFVTAQEKHIPLDVLLFKDDILKSYNDDLLKIANVLFECHDAGLLKIDYQSISGVSQLILDRLKTAETKLGVEKKM